MRVRDSECAGYAGRGTPSCPAALPYPTLPYRHVLPPCPTAMSARNKTANKTPTAPAHRHKIPGALVSLDTALLHVAKYDSHENALIVFESAINKCLISLDYAREIIKKIPRTRAEKLLSRLCVSSQSGSETRVRNFIQSLRFHVLPQCKISRIGTVYMVVTPGRLGAG